MGIAPRDLSQEEKQYKMVIATAKSLDGFPVTLCNDQSEILSQGHLLIDGYSCRVAEYTFHLAIVDRVQINKAYTVIYIRYESQCKGE